MMTMREYFRDWISVEIENHPNVWVVSPDFGFGTLDPIKDHPRYVNVGIAEQTAVLVAVGLALQGKRVYIYSIASFLLYRAMEQLRIYVDHLRLDIKIIALGHFGAYADLDYSHQPGPDLEVVKTALPNFTVLNFNQVCWEDWLVLLDATRLPGPYYCVMK